MFTPLSQTGRQCEFGFDESALVVGQVQEVAGIADDPSGALQPPALIFSHVADPSAML